MVKRSKGGQEYTAVIPLVSDLAWDSLSDATEGENIIGVYDREEIVFELNAQAEEGKAISKSTRERFNIPNYG